MMTTEVMRQAGRALAGCAERCSRFCDRSEHLEPAELGDVVGAGRELRLTAAWLCSVEGISLQALYAARLRFVEASSLHRFIDVGVESLSGADALDRSVTWADVQLAQNLHDRQFHPDVFGLAKSEQIRHYSFHVSKLAGLLSEAVAGNQWIGFRDTRLADVSIFGVKLATVCNQRLPPSEIGAVTRNCPV